jgi:hypothetical protein
MERRGKCFLNQRLRRAKSSTRFNKKSLASGGPWRHPLANGGCVGTAEPTEAPHWDPVGRLLFRDNVPGEFDPRCPHQQQKFQSAQVVIVVEQRSHPDCE